MDWTVIGAPPPIGTLPSWIRRVMRRGAIVRLGGASGEAEFRTGSCIATMLAESRQLKALG
jgi:hypothetical protein